VKGIWLSALLLSSVAAGAAGKLPNIVLIVSDNQSQSLLGTYGNTEILTPNLDRLADESDFADRVAAVANGSSRSVAGAGRRR